MLVLDLCVRKKIDPDYLMSNLYTTNDRGVPFMAPPGLVNVGFERSCAALSRSVATCPIQFAPTAVATLIRPLP